MKREEISILGATIPLNYDLMDINELSFLVDNPRVYTCVHKEKNFSSLEKNERQEIIFEALKKNSSVKNLISDIKRHKGLMEPILVRCDTNEVVEGNSRLAAYKILYEQESDEKWREIPCNLVSKLTYEQQTAYLSQIHIKGKTPWAAYEKANMSYESYQQGLSYQKIAELMGVRPSEIEKRVEAISIMLKNKDNKMENFSYYDAIIRNREISTACEKHPGLKKKLLKDIKSEDKEFTAQALRDQLPTIVKKPRICKKFIDGKIDLKDAYESAKTSKALNRIKQAIDILNEIEHKEIKKLTQNDKNALSSEMKKLKRVCKRIEDILKKID